MPESAPSLLLATPHALFRSALRAALVRETGARTVSEASDVASAVAAFRRFQPDLVVVDAELPGGATELCATLTAEAPLARVLVVATAATVPGLVSALEAGAIGFVSHDGQLEELVGAVRSSLAGEMFVPRLLLGGLLRELIDRRREEHTAVERFRNLSQREREVLERLTQGLDQDGIARALVISPQTARTHIQNVINKLAVHSRLEAANLAREHGFFGTLAKVT